ncbi:MULTISPECIES: GGDEF domain-containing protein [Brevundimonas]|uniref:GGDEF domain-containing protein n=1 Tax=Brevundimonas TaxID=41275 RepID=UPI0019037D95|nr:MULTISPECIES: GGDEF domain-containing protein [Brevundimonas]MBK1969613.1 GGDEF domain-containing protein [Brevundimonas diminuta]MDA0742482.1 GGDEF domain-containing protein [Pseudomonadota bacterium]MDA1322900.1 GGDEF domain-containing protein [Pseudomonadota bacterium]MDM8351932.1 GGDEF domain-containing protein [Brevundimonas diminuta]
MNHLAEQTTSAGDDAELRAEIGRLHAEVAALTERAERAEALADHDVLTPALNRRGFMTVLTRNLAYCRRHGVEAALLYLDLDGFKGINDGLGHAAGDAALIAVAELLLANVRESDAVGRMGGDEFTVVLMNAGAEEGREKARRLSEALQSEGFIWDERRVALGGSFGVRAFAGQTDAEVWLSEADAAMWLRKKARPEATR